MKYHIPNQLYLYDYRRLFAWIAFMFAVGVIVLTRLFGVI